MARGILGRSRAPEAIEIISNPGLKYSDAIPRTDLRDVKSVAHNSRPVNRAVAQWNFQRPRTADGRQPIKKGQGVNPGFDFQIAIPPAEAVPLPKSPDDDINANMIGIALGSPRMAEPQRILPQMQEQPPVSTSASPEQVSPQTKTLKRKPSKWRKIGGLFKAKNAFPATANQPFYQLRCAEEWPLQESTHSVDYKHQQEAAKSEPENATPQNLPNLEKWPCLEGKDESKSCVQSSSETVPQESVKNIDLASGTKLRTAGPFLQIDIPDVQLERYSVMFGGVLNQNTPSLLKRRSKTLEDVRIPKPDASIPPPDFQSPRRRATSPQPRLPSFNLFPTQAPVSKASKVLGSQNIPRGPSPLHRSQTSLSGIGRQTPTNDPNHDLLVVQSPSIKSPMLHQTKDSVSSTVSMDSTEEQRLLQKLKQTKIYVDKEQEPEWEIINKKPTSKGLSPRPSPIQNPTPSPRQRTPPLALKINTQVLPSTTSSISSAPSPHLSPINSAARDKPERNRSPVETLSAVFPFSATCMPLSDDTEDIEANEAMDPIPKVEVSIARSVSVSRGKKQVIVPIRPRAGRLNPNERLIVRQAKTPQVRDAQHGHRHGISQDVRIETI
ncbi:hypothetical protein KXV48_008875 [Aspergillus fumigatus]|nr:hypothetical protein KXV48_008875 [Aspergillus fumigatus]